MKKKIFKRVVMIIAVIITLYWLPFIIITLSGRSKIITHLDALPRADAVIIFGTLVNDAGDVSPLLKERLDTGKIILEAGGAKTIVVSNTEAAANIMANYLIAAGVNQNLVEIDIQANKTPDTCAYEKAKYPTSRQLIFVSQQFHLSRLLYQCKQLGVTGIAVPAEAFTTIDRSQYSLVTKIQVRVGRYIREAGLTWLALFNIY